MLKVATIEDVTHIAEHMRPHDRAERLALSHGNDAISAAVQFLQYPHLAVTVWRHSPIAVIGVVYPHPGVASTIFFATDGFRHVALSTTRFVRRTLIPILLSTGIHRLQVCSMENPADKHAHAWIESFGARQEAFLYQYGRNKEDFRLFSMSRERMALLTGV